MTNQVIIVTNKQKLTTNGFMFVYFLFLVPAEKSAEKEMAEESTKVETDSKFKFKYSPQIKFYL